MSRQAWKWVFEMMSDDEIATLAQSARVKVPGFRQINVEQMKILRPRLVQTMSTGRDLARVKHAIDDHTLNCDQCTGFRNKTQSELIHDIAEGSSPIKVLGALLSSPDSGKQLLGELLFETLQSSGALNEYVSAMTEVRRRSEERESVQNNLTKQNEEQLKLIKKYEEKIAKLEKAQATEAENQEVLLEQIKQLTEKLQDQQAEMKAERSKWMEERADLMRQLADKQALLDRKVLVVTASDEVAADAELGLLSNTSIKIEEKKPVALVGKPVAIKSPDYQIQTVEVNQVEQAFEQNLFGNVEQVWVLTYEAPLGTQRKLRRQIASERLREFHTLKELQRYIGHVIS